MSTISQKTLALQQVAAQIHTGAEVLSEVEKAVKQFVAGAQSTVDAPATTYAYTHSDQDQYLKLTGLTGATTINLTADSSLQVGAVLTIDVVQGATGYSLVAGTGILPAGATLITGVSLDRDIVELKYNGTEWIQKAASVKIVNAA
jgi:hypothetical protein